MHGLAAMRCEVEPVRPPRRPFPVGWLVPAGGRPGVARGFAHTVPDASRSPRLRQTLPVHTKRIRSATAMQLAVR